MVKDVNLVICMALLGDPKILLCDEIFAALDVLTIHMLKEILVNLQNENPKFVLLFVSTKQESYCLSWIGL